MRAAIAARNLRGRTGVSAIVLEHAREFVRRGHQVDIIGEKLNTELITATGARPIRLHRLPGPRYLARKYFSHRFDRLTRKAGYDLIIGNSEILNQDVLFVHNLSHLEAERVPGGISNGLQSKIDFDNDLYTRGSFRLCIANSKLAKSELVQRQGIDPTKIQIINPGFDPTVFTRTTDISDLRAELCEPDTLLLGFITSGHFAKRGADIMLNTLRRLEPDLRKKIRVLAVGSKKNTDELQQKFAAEGLSDSLICRDKTDDVARYYKAIDLLFYPARMEEFGLVVLESAACGTPVLTSSATGAAELFDPEDPLVLTEPEAAAFAVRLAELAVRPELLQQAADRQYAAVQPYTWDNFFERVFRCYEQLGDTGSPPV